MKFFFVCHVITLAWGSPITVKDCDGNEYLIPVSGSGESAIDQLIQEVTAASDTNGFARSIFAQMKTKLISLKSIVANSGSKSTIDILASAFTSVCPSLDDPDQVSSSSFPNQPVFGGGVLEDEQRGVFGRVSDFISGVGKKSAKFSPPATYRTFHSQQANIGSRDILSSKKSAHLNLYQGDMVYPKNLVVHAAKAKAATPVSTTSTWSAWNLWPNGRVSWYADSLTVDECAIATFRTSASYLEKYTCLRFTELTKPSSTADSIQLTSSGSSCWAYVGMSDESQVNLGGSGCQIPGIALHELGHGIGLVHQHSRLDRDGFVTVDWEDVQDSATQNFYKIKTGGSYDSLSQSTPYDYSSIMHYGACEFSTDPNRGSGCDETLVPADVSVVPLMGQRDHLSASDISLINAMYGCTATCGDGIQNQGEEGVDCGGPCSRICGNATSDGILPLPSQCAASSSRSLTTTEWIYLGCIVGGVALAIFLGFRIYLRRKQNRKDEAKKRLLATDPEQVRRILRQRKTQGSLRVPDEPTEIA
jgi:hypothetical protein